MKNIALNSDDSTAMQEIKQVGKIFIVLFLWIGFKNWHSNAICTQIKFSLWKDVFEGKTTIHLIVIYLCIHSKGLRHDDMSIFIEKSKTDIYRKRHWLHLAKFNSNLCPLDLTKRYFAGVDWGQNWQRYTMFGRLEFGRPNQLK